MISGNLRIMQYNNSFLRKLIQTSDFFTSLTKSVLKEIFNLCNVIHLTELKYKIQRMKVFHEKLFPIGLVFFIDVLLTAMSFVLSYALCSFILPDISSHTMLVQLPIIVAITSMIFLFIGIYRGFVKYDRLREVYSIFNAICLSNILTIVLVVINGQLVMENDLMVPLSIIIVHSVLSFSALVASRFLYKKIKSRIASKYKLLSKVLLVTTKELDDNDLTDINGRLEELKKHLVQVLFFPKEDDGSSFNLDQAYIDDNQISEIYVYNEDDCFDKFFEIITKIESLGTSINIVNDLKQFEASNLDYDTIFPSQFKNELVDNNATKKLVGKTILITGAGGCIGSEFAKRLYRLNIKVTLVLIDNSESSLNQISGFLSNSTSLKLTPRLVDIKDKKLMEKIFSDYKPSIVVHTAGNTFLEFLDNDQNKIIQQNLTSTKLIADLSKKHNVEKFVFCSSNRAIKPSTTLEVSKRLAEIYLESLNETSSKTNFTSVRLHKVYNTKNSAVNYIKGQIVLKRPINLRFINEEEVFTNLQDVVNTLLFLSVDEGDFKRGIFTTKLGVKIDAQLLIKIIGLIEFSGNHGSKQISYKNTFISEKIFKEYSSLKLYNNPNEFLEAQVVFGNLSKEKIKQKIEHICLNILFDDNDSEPIFEMINDFGSGDW